MFVDIETWQQITAMMGFGSFPSFDYLVDVEQGEPIMVSAEIALLVQQPIEKKQYTPGWNVQ